MAQEMMKATEEESNKQRQVEEIALQREARLAMFAAAFLKEVGTDKALDYVLVETRDANKTSWKWERKDGQPKIP